MNNLKFSAGLRTFHHRPDGNGKIIPLEESIAIAGQVRGLQAVECYQTDFDQIRLTDFKRLLDENGLAVSVVDTDLWGDPRWQYGTFTSRDAQLRRDAIEEAKRSVDIARQIGTPIVGLWLAYDGCDHPFQVDYHKQWELGLDGIKQVAMYAAPDVRIGLKYRSQEPRKHMAIGQVGKTLAICQELGLANLGVTIDFTYALTSRENPTESLTHIARSGKLCHIYFSDIDSEWDHEIIPATIHFWEVLEFLYYCRMIDYDGWFGLSLSPHHEDIVEATSIAIENIEALWCLARKIDAESLQRAQERMDVHQAQAVIHKALC
ncbi:MAG: sugar phosphate isomerase/epimerase [Chloroflexi bacterium]|nr:sugar phosphate isomerase/epimerase [Chloroflexota bacterium]MCL5075001.1 sugar phosphate isomerase/epimerase [Chloroflexota bacterium]